MARSVTISTPIPTIEEFGKSLGLSKRRQDSLLRLVRRDESASETVQLRDKTNASVTPATMQRLRTRA